MTTAPWLFHIDGGCLHCTSADILPEDTPEPIPVASITGMDIGPHYARPGPHVRISYTIPHGSASRVFYATDAAHAYTIASDLFTTLRTAIPDLPPPTVSDHMDPPYASGTPRAPVQQPTPPSLSPPITRPGCLLAILLLISIPALICCIIAT